MTQIKSLYQPGNGAGGRIRTYAYQYANKKLWQQRTVSKGTSSSANAANDGTLCGEAGNLCSGYGVWNTVTKQCDCYTGYSGADCEYECNPAITCNGHGTCNDAGMLWL